MDNLDIVLCIGSLSVTLSLLYCDRILHFCKVLSNERELRKILKEGLALLLIEKFLKLVYRKVHGLPLQEGELMALSDEVAWVVLLKEVCVRKVYLKYVETFPQYALIGELDFTDALNLYGVCI